MATLAKANGYKDLASFRDHIENDPKYKPASADAIVEDFRKYIAQMEPRLPELFNLLPKTAVTVEPIPPFQAAAATHYQGGTPDGKRPGRVSVAVSDPTHRSFINDEAVAYHEGVPGHHLQITIQQSLTGLPEFRKHGGNSAYTEGWGLYAEELGKEIGFYQDPGSDYGRLRSELFRAVRLVVDTGIHDMGWSRDQVVEYMRNSHAVDEPTIQAETDRYISGPGQACSYKLGQLKIRELRERSKQQLGPSSISRLFMTRSCPAERFRSTFSMPELIAGSNNSFPLALATEAVASDVEDCHCLARDGKMKRFANSRERIAFCRAAGISLINGSSQAVKFFG